MQTGKHGARCQFNAQSQLGNSIRTINWILWTWDFYRQSRENYEKLDRLLNLALAQAFDTQTKRLRGVEERTLFQTVFRFLAAKVLQDRSNPIAASWDPNKVETILDAISRYYQLPSSAIQPGTIADRVFTRVWECMRGGINFQNISADDLAFVYENTLVTEEVRKEFGTHSTPRQVAEYIVNYLGFHEHANNPEQLRVYEPFAGAAVLLISALRHLRELLPVTWTDQERHELLIKRMSGDELDGFACEVATLSLILADYPNHNGWIFAKKTCSKALRLSKQCAPIM